MATPSRVWIAPAAGPASPADAARSALRLAVAAGIDDLAAPNRLIGILQHVGEGRNIGHIKPAVTRAIADHLSARQAKPFLTGSATLYKGRRSNACDHILQAYEHGFTPDAIGCPIVMCDGLRGSDRIEVSVPRARHCPTAYLGSAVGLMDGLVVVTHPTGHIAAGFGAAIKNVSMGLSDRGGKMAMHHGGRPEFRAKACTACGRCAEWCPAEAITVNRTAELIGDRCIGCGQCLSVCPSDAIGFQWTHSGAEFQERLVEYCAAVRERIGDRIVYLNVCQHFTKECDCFDVRQDPICADVGILASRDPVAIDVATADRVARIAGRDLVREAGNREYRGMFAYAEELGDQKL